MRKGFVYLDEAIPYVRWDAKYFSADNFIGARVDGYNVNRVVGTEEMAQGIARAAGFVKAQGLGLLLWDGYRPARAVRRFLQWANEPEDGRTKRAHYPNIDKKDIVPMGYVCEQSGHSRGSAIDLTLCDIKTGTLLDMGGIFDLMDISSHHGAEGVSNLAADNRKLLRGVMEACGFVAYENEWWHYYLANEPYSDTFDFLIE